MRRISALACGLVLMAGAAAAQEVPSYAARCTGCHGANGNPQVDSTPRLNGQQKDYLLKRLDEFKGLGSLSPHGGITDGPAIAAWFAAQKPTPARPGPLSDVGRRIFQSGISARVIACRQCHGARGEGHDAVPRLAGQHRAYLDNQLGYFSIRLRDNKLMHTSTEKLKTFEMEAISSFLGSD